MALNQLFDMAKLKRSPLFKRQVLNKVKILPENQAMLQLLFNKMSEAYALHKILTNEKNEAVDYIFLDVNPAFEQLTGLKREQLIGKRVLEILPNTEKYWIEISGKVALEGIETVSSNYSRELDKHYSVKFFSPKPGYFAVMFTDVTSHIKHEEELKKISIDLANALDFNKKINFTSPSGIVMVNKDGEIIFANQRAEETLGLIFEDITCLRYNSPEWKITSLDGSPYPDEKLPFVMVRASGKAVNDIRHSIEWPDGKRVDLSINAVPQFTPEGDFDGMLATIENITDKVKAEQRLQEYNQQLNELVEAKDRFFSIIAHDLKGPLGSLQSITEMLHIDYANYSDEKRRHWIREIYFTSFKTSELLDNLLTWSRNQREMVQFQPEKISLLELADNIIHIQNAIALNKNITIQNNIPGLLYVQADREMLGAIIRNLISNALKFTKRDGSVTISAVLANHDGSYVRVDVADNGIGMTDELAASLFCGQGAPTSIGTDGEKGTGLGLSICREFVDKHGGKIWAQSKKGKGSVFSFTVPAN